MEISEIESLMNEISSKVAAINETIEDYKNCKSSTSKTILMAAITKMVAPFANSISR